MRSFYHSATNFLPFADRIPTSPEATEGESVKFNLYNPYLAPADMTSAPRVHFDIGRTVQPENFDLREEISDLGRQFGEAIAQKEAFYLLSLCGVAASEEEDLLECRRVEMIQKPFRQLRDFTEDDDDAH